MPVIQFEDYKIAYLDLHPVDNQALLIPDFGKELCFYILSCCGAAFLCMMFGCRMNVLRCRKFEMRSPPLVFLATLVSGIFTFGPDILLEHLIDCGVVEACHVGAVYPLVMVTLNKFLVFCYFIEAMHAIRACKACTQDTCKWYNRWRSDYIWSFFSIVAGVGCFGCLLHIAVAPQSGQYGPANSCLIIQKTTLAAHMLIWSLAFSCLLICAFCALGLCTVGHYPVLNDVGNWHYALRTRLFAILPSFVKMGNNEQYGADQLVVCPAYLVPLNGRTAGTSERSAFTTAMTVLLTLCPTVVNFGLLCRFSGKESSWLFFLMCNIDVWVNVVTVHLFSNDPTEKDENKRNEKMQAIMKNSPCGRTLGSSHCNPSGTMAIHQTTVFEVTNEKSPSTSYDDSIDTFVMAPSRTCFVGRNPFVLPLSSKPSIRMRSGSGDSSRETDSPGVRVPDTPTTLVEEPQIGHSEEGRSKV